MNIGDMVKIEAPESIVGWCAGKRGIVIRKCTGRSGYHDYVLYVIDPRGSTTGTHQVYVAENEIKLISPANIGDTNGSG